MTKEENYIICRDLCSRLPYGVKVYVENALEENHIQTLEGIEVYFGDIAIPGATIYTEYEKLFWDKFKDMPKPYLRSMEKMTDDEKKELDEVDWCITDENFTDWLNRHYFDHNGLIPIDLAIEAPEDMYKVKENMYDIKYHWYERQ